MKGLAEFEAANKAHLQGNHQTALEYCNQFLENLGDAAQWTDTSDQLRIKVISLKANVLRRTAEESDFLTFMQQYLTAFKKNSLEQWRMPLLNILGIFYYSKMDFLTAEEMWQQAIELAEKYQSDEYKARVLSNMANIQARIGNFSKCLEMNERALSIMPDDFKDSDGRRIVGIVGNILTELNQFDRAESYFKRNIEENQRDGNFEALAVAAYNYGVMLDKAHRPEESLSVIGLALESNEKLNNRLRFVQCSLVKAQVYMGLDNPDAAIKIYEELENSGSLNDFPDQRYGFLLLLATHYMDIASSNKELEHALSLAEEAIKIEEKYGVGTADSHLIKAKVNKKLGRWEQHATSIELYIEKYQTQLNLDVSSRAKQFDQQRELENAERDRQVNLARFQEQEKILHNMLPASIANRMMEGEKTIADDFRHASIFFSDIVGFTEMSASVNSSTLVNLLNDIFREFDRIADKYQIEKIKTIGDAYMAVAGVPVADPGHAKNIAQFALEVSESMKHFTLNEKPVQLRIGLHTGEVVAGVIGERKFAFDLWGDSVNVAFRMESSGEPGTIHVSEAFKNAINEASFCFEERGEVHVKGKGNMKTFFLSKA